MFTARTLAGPAGLNPLKALQGPTFLGLLARLLTRLADRLEQHGEARRRERQRRKTERALRLTPREDARQRAAELMPEAKSHWHAQLTAYQILSLDELFQVQDVVLTVSLAALISQPGVRVTCA